MIAALSAEEGVEPPAFTAALFRAQGFGAGRLFEPLVAERNGRLAGLAMLTRGYDSQTATAGVVLEDLYVEPGARRCGVGRALVREAARRSAAGGGAWVAWHVRSTNVRAQLFYRSLGAAVERVDLMGLAGEAFDTILNLGAGPGT